VITTGEEIDKKREEYMIEKREDDAEIERRTKA
jgi:hypothetical protein